MIPFILAAIGGYLVGEATEPDKFGDGGSIDFNDFRAKVDDIDVKGFAKFLGAEKADVSVNSLVQVVYDLRPEARNWGIKNILINIRGIVATLDWEVDTEGLSESEISSLVKAGGKKYKEKIEGSFEIISKEWGIINELEFSKDGGFKIYNCEFDFGKKTITLL